MLACLEIDLAIMCASVPIFWPVIEAKFSHIFVTHEVRITEHQRLDDHGIGYELEHTGSLKSQRSMSGNRTSEEELTRENTRNPFGHYKDPYVVAHVNPLAEDVPGTGVETEVQSKPQPKWRL